MLRPAVLALEEGSCFEGSAFGYVAHPFYSVGEVVFNTAMTGYQEILSDPSYAGQLIALSYPEIGNVGVNREDRESDKIHARGLIVKKLPALASNWRQEASLEDYLIQHGVMGIVGVDTRRLVRLIREKGALKGCLYVAASQALSCEEREEAIARARAFGGIQGVDLAKEVTTRSSYSWPDTRLHKAKWHVVAYDFGIKRMILRCLEAENIDVTVVPATTSVESVLALSPDGIFLSNGPGDPAPCTYAISAIRQFLERGIPLFGICLGHQLLALACGAKTIKMKYGHHGANHPVKRLDDGAVLITSQNHGFTVDDVALPSCLEVTHRSLFDNTVQGIRHRHVPAFGFQGHPEAGPGPHDAVGLFKDFLMAMAQYRAIRQDTTRVLETV